MRNKLIIPLVVGLFVATSCTEIEIGRGLMGFDDWEYTKNCYYMGNNSLWNYINHDAKECTENKIYELWDELRTNGKDTTYFVLDFTTIMPFEWDTLVYIDYHPWFRDRITPEIEAFTKKYNINDFIEGLFALKGDKIVYYVYLPMGSELAKGMFFCTNKFFIKRDRNDACFSVQKKKQFFILRDMTEEYVHSWRYIDEEEGY